MLVSNIESNTACGDPYRGVSKLSPGMEIVSDQLIPEIAPLEDFFGLNSHYHRLFESLRPHYTYFTDYDPSQQHRAANGPFQFLPLTFFLFAQRPPILSPCGFSLLFRIGQNHTVINLILRIHLPSLSAVALLTIRESLTNLAAIRSR